MDFPRANRERGDCPGTVLIRIANIIVVEVVDDPLLTLWGHSCMETLPEVGSSCQRRQREDRRRVLTSFEGRVQTPCFGCILPADHTVEHACKCSG